VGAQRRAAEPGRAGRWGLSCAQLALANRVATSEKYDAACKSTRKKKEAVDKARGDKVGKAQSDLAEAEKLEADLKEAFFHVSEALKGEFARVDAERAHDTRHAMTTVANHQLKLAKDVRSILEAFPRA
jgi:saccharopine dehydrogenase-like NADP-dependent oxidoreductase